MAKQRNEFLDVVWDTMKENGKLLTVFACAAIIIGGITLIEAPQNWWIALLAVTGFFFVLFVFMNARVVLKAIATFLVTILLSAFAFNISIMSDLLASSAFIWFFGHYVTLFLCLTISYFLPSGQSRWTTLTFAVGIYFASVWGLVLIANNLTVASVVAVLVAVGVFVLLYLFGGKSRFASKIMPQPVIENPELAAHIKTAAEHAGFNFRDVSTKEDSAYLVWDKRAYVLYPVKMDQAFGIIGKRKKTQLSYKGKPINAWLRFLSFTKNPYLKARGADTLLVLLDMNNKNGTDYKTIGVSMPDSRAVTPVGVMPARQLLASEDKVLRKALVRIDPNFKAFVTDLTDKQKASLAKIGVTKKDSKKDSETAATSV